MRYSWKLFAGIEVFAHTLLLQWGACVQWSPVFPVQLTEAAVTFMLTSGEMRHITTFTMDFCHKKTSHAYKSLLFILEKNKQVMAVNKL